MTKELIEELLDRADRDWRFMNTEGADLLRRAADALAARQPTEDNKEAARVFLEAAIAESEADVADGGGGWDIEVDARTVLDLLDEPRAAVPDAAKCQSCDRGAAFCAHCTAEGVPDAATERWKNFYFIQKRAADELEAERDAALAAVERVAKIHGPSEEFPAGCDYCERLTPCSTRAALDGAPEPGRELQLERAARELNSFGWTCHGGTHEPGDYDSCEDCQTVCIEVARAAFHAMSGTPRLSADQVWTIAKAEHDYATDTDNVPAFVMPLVDGLRAAGVTFDEQPFIDSGYLLPVEGSES